MSIFTGKNIYEALPSGSLSRTTDATAYSDEPTGVAVNPANNHLFISDDVKRMVFVIDPGNDGQVNTSDDKVTSFSTTAFGSSDPEGVAYGQGVLFIADGAGSEIYRVDPGSNGLFDGIASGGDDQISHFDTSALGESDPEGIEYNPDSGTLFIVGHGNRNLMLEISPSGSLVRTIDISAARAVNPSGLAYGANSTNPSTRSFYIVDRGIDNNSNPSENDGKIYEMTIDSANPVSPFPSGQISPVPTISPNATDCSRKAQGDANCNGNVDFVDYDYYRRTVLLDPSVPANVSADFNGDGETGVMDGTILIQTLGL